MIHLVNDFIAGFFLWRDAVFASMIVACLCGWLGVYINLKRIVFVSAALPQISGLGIAFAFYAGSFFGDHGHNFSFLLNPWITSLAFSLLAAGLFSLNKDHRILKSETVIGIGYILSAAFVLEILNSPRIIQEAHEIGDILFGNAVIVESATLMIILGATVVIFLVHLLFYRQFLAVMFDHEMASTLGLNVKAFNLLLYFTIAVAVSVATRTIGALPVFGFMVIPPACGLMLARSLKKAIFVSMGIGVVSAFLGYFFSFVLSTPTGATMVGVAGVFLIPGFFRVRTAS